MLRSCERNDAKEPHFYIHFFLSLGEEGALLHLRLVTASKPTYALFTATSEAKVERRLPLRRARHSQLPKADPFPSAPQLLAQRRRSPLQPHCTLEVTALRAGLDLALTH